MKSRLLLLLIMIASGAEGQHPCVNGISTNPANPVNTQLTSKRNTFFNWQVSTWYQKSLPNQGNCTRLDTMTSPFFRLDNTEELRESKDMLWDDGWELILRRVGLSDANTPLPDNDPDIAVVLYNKYTGILRILLKTCRGADYNAARIELKFHSTSLIQTDLLDMSRGQISALDKVFSTTFFAAGYPYTNNNSKWFYADFPMTYDPCTCTYKSKLNIVSHLIANSQINIVGSIAGDVYTKDVGGKAQVDQPGSYTWKDISGFVNSKLMAAHSSIDKFRTSTKNFAESLQDPIDKTAKKDAIDKLSDIQKFGNFLKGGLASLPFLSSAVSLIDVFVGGGKTKTGPQEVKILPLTVNLTTKLSGTISTSSQYHDIIFTNPGSKDAHLDPDIYAYYNEVLGVFNLIKTPEVWWERREENLNDGWNYQGLGCPFPNQPIAGQCQQFRVIVDRFRLDTNSFKYVLNPAAGVTIQNMKMALITEGVHAPNYNAGPGNDTLRLMNPDFSYEGRDAISGEQKFRTTYLDGRCFANRTFKAITSKNANVPFIHYGYWTAWRPKGIVAGDTTLYLKIMLNLRRNNATDSTQNILHVLTYPVKLVAANNMQYWTNNTACGVFYSDDQLIVPAGTTEVNNFCNSLVYNNPNTRARVVFGGVILDSLRQEAEKTIGIRLSPNPSSGQIILTLLKQNSTVSAIRIVDITGRAVFISNEGNKPIGTGYTKVLHLNFPRGTYYLSAVTNTGMLQSKLIIMR